MKDESAAYANRADDFASDDSCDRSAHEVGSGGVRGRASPIGLLAPIGGYELAARSQQRNAILPFDLHLGVLSDERQRNGGLALHAGAEGRVLRLKVHHQSDLTSAFVVAARGRHRSGHDMVSTDRPPPDQIRLVL